MSSTIVNTDKAPKAVGPYVQGRLVQLDSQIIFTSGSLGLVPETMKFIDDNDVEKQTEQALKNLEEVLKAANSSLKSVVKTNVFLADIEDFKKVNEVYLKYFNDHKPARSCVSCKELPLGAKFEIECIALTNQQEEPSIQKQTNGEDKLKVIHTDKAPKAVGPYVQGRIVDNKCNLVFSSGSLGLIPDTGKFIDENDVQKQARQALQNLEEVLKQAGSSFKNVIKTTVFLQNMSDFKQVNEVYTEFFNEFKPARSCVAMKTLPLNALFEIECIAYVNQALKERQQFISTEKAPKAVGPYVQGRVIQNNQILFFSSGTIGLIPDTGKFIDEKDVEKQARQSLQNLEQVLQAAGSSFNDVIKTTVFVHDMNDFKKANEVYSEYFKDHKPARSCVAANQLPLGALYEIECIAIQKK